MRIVHITNFNERHDGRLYLNTGRRINNGLIRLGHSVLDIYIDRDIQKYYKNCTRFIWYQKIKFNKLLTYVIILNLT